MLSIRPPLGLSRAVWLCGLVCNVSAAAESAAAPIDPATNPPVRPEEVERDRALQKLDASEQRVTRTTEALRQCREQQARHATSRDDKVAALQAEVTRLGRALADETKRVEALARERNALREMQRGVAR